MGHGASPATAPAPQVFTGSTPTTFVAQPYSTGSFGLRTYDNGINWYFTAAHAPLDNYWVEDGTSDCGVPSLYYGVDWSGTPSGSQITYVGPVNRDSLFLPSGFEVASWDPTPLLRKQSQNNGQPAPATVLVAHTAPWDQTSGPGTATDSSGNPRGAQPGQFLYYHLQGPLLGWTLFGPQSSFLITNRNSDPTGRTVDLVDTSVFGSGAGIGFRVGESSPGLIDWGDGSAPALSYGGYYTPNYYTFGSHVYADAGIYTVRLTRMAGTQFESIASTVWTVDTLKKPHLALRAVPASGTAPLTVNLAGTIGAA